MDVTIQASVGKGGTNMRADVRKVQDLLNDAGAAPKLAVDGLVGPNTVNAIVKFQRRFMQNPDGRVDPGGRTLRELNAADRPIEASPYPKPERKPTEFTGDSTAPQYIRAIADGINAEPAAVAAVLKIESAGRGGFLRDGRILILFEGHVFWRQLRDRGLNPASLQKGNEDILYPRWTKVHYKGGAGEYDRLNKAKAINEEAALASASWGKFQIMGFNHRAAGYPTVKGFVDAQKSSQEQDRAFINFVKSEGLVRHLQTKDWAKFARGYNGPGYKENQYDTKMASAYKAYREQGY